MTVPQIDRDARLVISIHIPRAGDDPAGVISGRVANAFQSTSPVRGMTVRIARETAAVGISIHIPRAGDDLLLFCGLDKRGNFNPHPPCGG